jgi:hypothetical protein
VRSRRARRPWWAIGLLTLGGLWLLYVGCIFVTGYSTTVTVTGGAGDGFCDVVWEDPDGRRLEGEADCYDEPPGTRFHVRVSGWPDAGEPTPQEIYLLLGLLFGLPPVALGGVLRARWRRPSSRRDGGPDWLTALLDW